MKNAGQTFVRAMQIILKPLKEFANSYVDSYAVHSNTSNSLEFAHHPVDNISFLQISSLSVTIKLHQSRLFATLDADLSM